MRLVFVCRGDHGNDILLKSAGAATETVGPDRANSSALESRRIHELLTNRQQTLVEMINLRTDPLSPQHWLFDESIRS